MTVAELLKSHNITEEVISGLPKEVVAHLEGYVTQADTKLQTATSEATKAEEARRQAELERTEINNYVETYGKTLTDSASVKAENDALKTYLESLKTQGFDIKIPTVTASGAKPAVAGSPAIGENAIKDLRAEVGTVLSQWMDGNNEHIRLFGTPIPDSSESIAVEAGRARKSVGAYIEEKYKFSDKRQANQQKAFDDRVNSEVEKRDAARKQKEAEERSSNPNLRPGESSRNSFVPRVKTEDFHKADGNVPTRERHRRLLDNIHKDREAAIANA